MSADQLTTGQVAKLCHVTARTVAKWMEKGLLKGYMLPLSGHRRIPKANLVAFMKAHGMPMEGLEEPAKP